MWRAQKLVVPAARRTLHRDMSSFLLCRLPFFKKQLWEESKSHCRNEVSSLVLREGDRSRSRDIRPSSALRQQIDLSSVSGARERRESRGQAICRALANNLQSLKYEVDKMPPHPPIWSASSARRRLTKGELKIRGIIVGSTRHVVHELGKKVTLGEIDPSGEDGPSVSLICAKVFQLYYESMGNNPDEVSYAFDECRGLLDAMRSWNIDLQAEHCEYAILVAALADRWSDGSQLYWNFIDPDRAGYKPCSISVANPVGLYVMARAAKEKGNPVVEQVFDAVLRMSMVSPSDQDKCE